jgi:integrase
MPVKMITPAVIVDKVTFGRDKVPLRKLWVEKHPTASHLQSYLSRIFSLAKADCGLATNPAALKDNLQHLLPDHRHKAKSRASLPREDLPKFMADLRHYEDRSARKTGHTTTAYALEFAVLTAARVDEVCQAQWKEIEGDVWTVPPEHLKTGHIHGESRRRPITPSMRAVLTAMERRHPNHSPDDLIFPATIGGQIDTGSLRRVVDRMGWSIEITAHGFRTTFNDWRRGNSYSDNLYDEQLDHLAKGKVAQAYERDDLLPERKKMMEAYDAYASRPEPYSDNVVDLRKAKEA